MNEPSSAASAAPPLPTPPVVRRAAWQGWALLASGIVAVSALGLGWSTQQKVQRLQKELVKRQQDSQGESAQAVVMARQAQDAAREAAARVALLDARVSEAALQRTQIEELLQSLSRSRDENVVADVEAALRVALQHSSLTGSVQPLLQALQQAEQRLARYDQPRLERVRRALAQDIERAKAVGVGDVAALTLQLDEAVRGVDELPLQSDPGTGLRRAAPAARAAASVPAAAASAASAGAAWGERLAVLWRDWGGRLWAELRSLVRVTRVDHPESLLLAPEQQYFVRENLKLRLLNARLALLSRQFATAQSDLRESQAMLERYFDADARRVQSMSALLQEVAAQARQAVLPRPDETLAALAAVAAGR